MDELVDKAAERARLNRELDAARKQLSQAQAKLNNPGFTGKAPANVVEGVRQNAAKLQERIGMIEESLKTMK